jgi:hypothetical protein
MQAGQARNSSDGRVIRRRVGLLVVLGLLVAQVATGMFWGANETTEGGQAVLGGLGLLLVSAGSVIVVLGGPRQRLKARS